MSDQWFREQCPSCGQVNWVCNGDPDDITGLDVEVIECFKCNKRWTLDYDPTEREVMYGDISDEEYLESAIVQKGRINPNNAAT